MSSIADELRHERRELKRALEAVEFYKQKLIVSEQQNQRLRLREAGLVHRLAIAESTQLSTASQLNGVIQEDKIRDLAAFTELRNKVIELSLAESYQLQTLCLEVESLKSSKESLKTFLNVELELCKQGLLSLVEEYMKNQSTKCKLESETILTTSNRLRQSLDLLKQALRESLVTAQKDVLEVFQAYSLGYLQELRKELAVSKNDIKEQIESTKQTCLDAVSKFILCERKQTEIVLNAMKEKLHLETLNLPLFWDYVTGPDQEKLQNFMRTCDSMKVIKLERELESLRMSELKAKKIALKTSEKRQREVEMERNKVKQVENKLEEALLALDQARVNFDNVSLVVEQLMHRDEPNKSQASNIEDEEEEEVIG